MSSTKNPDIYLEAAIDQIAFHLGVKRDGIPPYISDADRASIEGVTVKTVQHRRWLGKDKLPTIKRGRMRATMTDALAKSMAEQARQSIRGAA